jgi:GNAT superfamily N-acetyltransferase
MNDLALSLRQARPSDAADLARIYIESWQDTYPGLLPHGLLGGMSLKSHTARWRSTIRNGGGVLVAEADKAGVIGLASMGPARDGSLGFDGEVYTLYVDPAFLGMGTGTALLHGAFAALKDRKYHSCLIWSHARNNACFFYEAMGGQRIAERTTRLGGAPVPEIAFGWRRLAVQPRRIAI